MATLVDQGIVLRVWDWSETSQTAVIFCREHGILRGVAKGSKRERSRFSGGLDLLTRGEIVAIVRENRDLGTLTEWDLQEVYWGPRHDLKAHYLGMYAADVVQHCLAAADPHAELWETLARTLKDLESKDQQAGAILRLQWAALVETGHRPMLIDCPDGETAGFDPAEGRLVDDPGGRARLNGPWRIRGATVGLLRALDGQSMDIGLGDEDPRTLERGNRFLATYLAWVLGRELPSRGMALGEWGMA